LPVGSGPDTASRRAAKSNGSSTSSTAAISSDAATGSATGSNALGASASDSASTAYSVWSADSASTANSVWSSASAASKPVWVSSSAEWSSASAASISGSTAASAHVGSAGISVHGGVASTSASRIRSDVGHAIGSATGGAASCPLRSRTSIVSVSLSVIAPPAATLPNGAGMMSWPRFGAHDRQRPSASFQQLPHVYWRQFMQKLNVLWKASSCCAVCSRSVSLRAAAIASSIDESSDMTKLRSPRDITLRPLSLTLGAADSNV
jgi:hypothetical protein